jgi:hypothetical protein
MSLCIINLFPSSRYENNKQPRIDIPPDSDTMSDYTPVPLEAEASVDARITEEHIHERRHLLEKRKQEAVNTRHQNSRDSRTRIVNYYLEQTQREHVLETLVQMTMEEKDRAILVDGGKCNFDTSCKQHHLLDTPLPKLDINHAKITTLIPEDMLDKSIIDIIRSFLPEDCRVYSEEAATDYRITLHRGPLYNDPLCQLCLTYHQSRSCYTCFSEMGCWICCLPAIMPCINVHLYSSSSLCCDELYYSRRPDKDS